MARQQLQLSLLPTITAKASQRAIELDRLRVDKKRIEQEINDLTPQVMKDLQSGNLRFPDDSPFERLIKVPGNNTRINPAKLLAAGVKAAIITRCTDKTTYEYPRLIRKGEGHEQIDLFKKKGKKR